jgi:DHA2 family lincomycin resistance protein-like MFS transporter
MPDAVAAHHRTPQEHSQVTTTSAPPAADTSPAGTAAPERPTPSRATTLARTVLVLPAFVMVLDETMPSVALRVLAVDPGVAATTVQWLTSGFLLTMAVVIPLTGCLLDRFTLRQAFVAAMGVSAVGTLGSRTSGGMPDADGLQLGFVAAACVGVPTLAAAPFVRGSRGVDSARS